MITDDPLYDLIVGLSKRVQRLEDRLSTPTCAVPPPPAPASQEDVDRQAFELWFMEHMRREKSLVPRETWAAALAWERSRKTDGRSDEGVINDLIDERDSLDQVIEDLLSACGFENGRDYEWSSSFGYKDAVNMVREQQDNITEQIKAAESRSSKEMNK